MKAKNWEVILSNELKAAQSQSFCWGQNDCATWAFSVRNKLLGLSEFQPDWTGKYKSRLGAKRYMQEQGWQNMYDLATKMLGQSLPVSFATRGDIVLVDDALGICAGSFSFFLGLNGLVKRPTLKCHNTWKT